MNSLVESAKSDEMPDIVWIVLEQAYKFHASARIDDQTYHEQLDRLEREELHPRGLALCVEDRPDGGVCFSICHCKSREVFHKLACGPILDGEQAAAAGDKQPPASLASQILPAC